MGFLSKLFGKKKDGVQNDSSSLPQKNAGQNVSATVKVNTEISGPEIPSFQGDYAKTIFLWANSHAAPVKKHDEYVRYLMYECGIRDSHKYHLALIKEGYFKAASVQTILETKTVAELKQILSELGAQVSGKKSVLIERVMGLSNETILKKIITEEYYELSEKGISFLESHNDYVLIHKHRNWGVDWHEYEVYHKPGYSYYDTMWGIFNKRILNNKHNYGRFEYFCMHQLCEEEGKRERALEMLLRVLYIDLSGVCGIESFNLLRAGLYDKKKVLEHFDISIMLAPGIVNGVIKYHDIYDDTYVDRLYEQKLPLQICSKEMFLSIVHSVLDGSYSEEATKELLYAAYTKVVEKLK